MTSRIKRSHAQQRLIEELINHKALSARTDFALAVSTSFVYHLDRNVSVLDPLLTAAKYGDEGGTGCVPSITKRKIKTTTNQQKTGDNLPIALQNVQAKLKYVLINVERNHQQKL